MIRENQKYFNILQVFFDMCSVVGCFCLAYYIRFFILPNGIINISFYRILLTIFYMLPVYFGLYSVFDLYNSRRIKSFRREAFNIFISNIIGLFILIVSLFLLKIIHFSRYHLFIFFVLNTNCTIFMRGMIRFTLRKCRKKGFNKKHCLVIGTGETSHSLLRKIIRHPEWGYGVIGVVCTNAYPDTVFDGYRVLGELDDLENIFQDFYIDIAIIATNEQNAPHLGKMIYLCEKAGVKTHIVPYYHKYVPAKPYIDDLDGLPIIDTRHVPLDNLFKHLSKRLFDISFALIAIILTSPLLIFSAIMVKLTSPGPIIFKQERIGLNRKPFMMYKFRSMRVQTKAEEQDKWTTKNDPRKTKWGSFIRRTSIDELPQFFNVLKGDMSVVGPRPERPFFVDKFKEEIPRYMIKHQVRPGITGWAQVNGYRGDTSIEARIEHDLYYIENWSMGLDIKIIVLTVFKGFINQNAY